MSRDPVRGVGERILGFCFGALVCALCLTLAVKLLQSIWIWLCILAFVGVVSWILWVRLRRW